MNMQKVCFFMIIAYFSPTLGSNEKLQSDLQNLVNVAIFVKHIEPENRRLKTDDVNIGNLLLRRTIPYPLIDWTQVEVYFQYPKHKIAYATKTEFVQAWQTLLKNLDQAKNSWLAGERKTVIQSAMNIIALTKKIREAHPFTPHNQKQLLECAQLYGVKKEEFVSNLKKRSRELQENLFRLLERTRPNFQELKRLAIAYNAQLSGRIRKEKRVMPKDPLFLFKKKPAGLYGNELLEHIEGIITTAEQSLTIRQCTEFYQGPRIWLMGLRHAQKKAKGRLKRFSLAANQEALLPNNLQEILIRLCEERETETLCFLFLNAPELLKIKNEKNQTLAETVEAQKNLAAQDTLNVLCLTKS